MNIRIQSIHFDADTKLKEFITKKVNKLETFFDKIIDAEVILKLENDTSSVRTKIAEIKLNVPGNSLFVEESAKTFEQATDMSISALTRQLKKYKEKMKNK